jgi:hypothetical protein
MLKLINPRAVARGILPDPITGTVGNLDTLEFYEIADRLSDSTTRSRVTFLAASDIYTEGPVNIRIILEEE